MFSVCINHSIFKATRFLQKALYADLQKKNYSFLCFLKVAMRKIEPMLKDNYNLSLFMLKINCGITNNLQVISQITCHFHLIILALKAAWSTRILRVALEYQSLDK